MTGLLFVIIDYFLVSSFLQKGNQNDVIDLIIVYSIIWCGFEQSKVVLSRQEVVVDVVSVDQNSRISRFARFSFACETTDDVDESTRNFLSRLETFARNKV